ncbi:MAG: hypothetical protein WA208_09050 [Thermoanaerobaculia bacterium]
MHEKIRIVFARPEGQCRPVETITELVNAGRLRRWRPDPTDTGDCEESCYDLASDLVENGHSDFRIVSGRIRNDNGRVKHMWLEWDGFVLDVSNAGARKGVYLAQDMATQLAIWTPLMVKRWHPHAFLKKFIRK